MINERTDTTLGKFATRPVGTTGHEILADGKVVAWTVDGYWALRLLSLLVKADEDGRTK